MTTVKAIPGKAKIEVLDDGSISISGWEFSDASVDPVAVAVAVLRALATGLRIPTSDTSAETK